MLPSVMRSLKYRANSWWLYA